MTDFERSSGNVYADLGIPDAESMQVKAQLASKISEIIKRKKLTQMKAAELLGMPQSKVSNMLRGHFHGISETKMLDCLVRLGRDVDIVIGPSRRRKTAGSMAVRFST